MSHNLSPLGLSSKGQQYAKGDLVANAFEIIRNIWHPTDKPDGWLSLGVAENDIMQAKLVTYIEENFTLSPKLLTYNDGGAGSRRLTVALANFLNKHLHPVNPIRSKDIVVTNGCSAAVERTAFALGDPGDGFLLGRPYYLAFIPDVEISSGAKIVPVSFGDVDPMGIDAVQCYENTIKEWQSQKKPVKALILCNPHNPLGRCYPRDVVIAYMKLCQKYRIHLISDEIYALSVWKNTVDSSPPPTPFVSALSIPTEGLIDSHLVHVLWGMSKDFGANGLRIGAVISPSNPDLIAVLQTTSLYTYPSNLADDIAATILEDSAFTTTYISENTQGLSDRYALAARFMTDHSIPYRPGANAAFFICADLATAYRARHPDTKVGDEDIQPLLMRNLQKRKVYLVDSDAMGSEQPGWFRVVFSQNEVYLLEGLRRIVAALDDGDGEAANGDHGTTTATAAGVNGDQGIPTRIKLDNDRTDVPDQAVIAS